MKSLLVTANAESTGKTAITLALASIAQERDGSIGYMKPKGTRLQSNVGKTLDEDPMLAKELLGLDAEMHELEPVVYSPTFIQQVVRGREDADEVRKRISEAFDSLAADQDQMFLEGGGLSTGNIIDIADGDIAELVDAEVLLVCSYNRINDVDEVLAAVDDIGRDRLRGVVFNRVPDGVYEELEDDVVPFLEKRGVPVVGIVPREKHLAGVTVQELADELGADVLTDVAMDGFVERFSVGAMGADAALRGFRRTKDAAVITGGDRADIQSAALEAPGVKCLILTGGHRPSGAVLGKAAEKGVPIMVVQANTITTVERAEDVVRVGRTRDEQTVETMVELLRNHADVDALL
ncbi:phosphotransacetylase family protein [Haloarchaeobius sp. HME9146]|uniref:phosphotransacetylase family protein n=1 Tax=Haloarchaeobius sp. HME9146 TaxID=2978732 RepID=UPI0021BE2295|nr:phosphotransacetylase family protein [Haloarchaeobius sp. HME9146]MCT9096815.1 phosphotransacetylase family protein [Haloarchaeobius sp. HME9146]